MQTYSISKGTPEVHSFFDTDTNTVSHIAIDTKTNKAAIIDSVLDFDPKAGRTSLESANKLIEFIKSNSLEVEWLIETHAHADHLSAAPYLQKELGGTLAIGENIKIVQEVFGKIFNFGTEFARDASQFDRLFKDNDTFKLGSIDCKVIHTPGHTPADTTVIIGDAGFVGDTLFMPDFGTARCDFPGGSAEDLYDSIHKIYQLPDQTRLFMCHDYLPEGRNTYAWQSTVAEQKKSNIHVKIENNKQEFVQMRTKRDKTLSMPRLILPSVQVNINAGKLPPAEDNGTQYLKIPIDIL